MDGNGRWAAHRDLPRTAGHTEGEENLARIVRVAVTRNVGWLTVFGFSTENWVRPRGEVRHILGLHEKLFGRVRELNELNVRIQWIGRPFDSPAARTPKYVQRAIRKAINDTSTNTGMVLTVAFDYGGRAELMSAVRAARAAGQPITPDTIDAHLYLPELPPVDVMVRTSGEQRVSNFLLWQSAGSKIHFTEAAWPDFDAADLDAAIALVSMTRRRSDRCGGRRARRRHRRACRRPRTARPAPRWPSSVVGCDRTRSPPRRAGRHRHRQDARLPRAGDRLGQAHRRRHRHQGAPGSARHQGPPVPRRAVAAAGRRLRLGRAQGAQQLRVPPAAAGNERSGPGPARPRRDVGHHQARDQAARRVGGHHRRPAIRPNSTGTRPTARGGRSASAPTSARGPTVARWDRSASPNSPGGAPRPPT